MSYNNIELLSQELIEHSHNKETINQLLLNGANINYKTSSTWCLLFEFIANADFKSIKYFSKKQLNINIRDNKGRNSLFWAIYFNNDEIFKLLIHLGVNVNNDIIYGIPALHYAVYKNNIEIVKFLLKEKANKLKIDIFGKTAIQYAIRYKHKEIEMLLKNEDI